MASLARRLEPRIFGMPMFLRANSAARTSGQYSNCDTASNTLASVFRDTVFEPLVTRDTVAMETPASLATSFIVLGTLLTPISA